MQKSDLTQYQCPELFVRFKLQLVAALGRDKAVQFIIRDEDKASISDIQRYLNNKHIPFSVTKVKEQLIISVETKASV
ncbi:hypothetical protein AAEU32_15150 [Pseudoalteromonas sp. SSDWG2]|uniref:hypothetical protein n=1 Tax=Pseudoalteromonas sp. SSDWG2 TaxID=3139391 RepID=UPI003BAB63DB